MVESSNPVKTLLKWGWFEALLSLRQSLNCLWPFRVLIWEFWYDLWGPTPSKSQTLNLFSWNCPKALLCLLEIFRLVFQLPVLHSPRTGKCCRRKSVTCLKRATQISTKALLVFVFPAKVAPVTTKPVPSALVIDKCPQVKNGNKKSAHLSAGPLLAKYRSSSFAPQLFSAACRDRWFPYLSGSLGTALSCYGLLYPTWK